MSTGRQQWTPEEEAQIQTLLIKKLGPEYVSRRQGGGGSVPYIEAWKAIGLANDIFQFNGWSSEVKSISVEYVDFADGKYSIGVSALVRVTLKDGSYREDCGFGSVDNVKYKSMGLDKCRKEACTDALKRTLRLFGNALGNCLYDSAYIRRVGAVTRSLLPFDETKLVRPGKLFEEVPKEEIPYVADDSTAAAVSGPAEVDSHGKSSNTASVERVRPPVSKASVDPASPQELPDGAAALIFSQDLLSDDITAADLEDYPGVGDLSETNVLLASIQELSKDDEINDQEEKCAKELDQSVSMETPTPAAPPHLEVGFVSARGAELLLNNKPLASEDMFDPTFQSPNIPRTLDHNKSVPVQRPKSVSATNAALDNTPVAPRMSTRSMAVAPRTPLSEKTSNIDQRAEKRPKLA